MGNNGIRNENTMHFDKEAWGWCCFRCWLCCFSLFEELSWKMYTSLWCLNIVWETAKQRHYSPQKENFFFYPGSTRPKREISGEICCTVWTTCHMSCSIKWSRWHLTEVWIKHRAPTATEGHKLKGVNMRVEPLLTFISEAALWLKMSRWESGAGK